jgi:transcriptional regulator with XRE-family HTH domain
VIKFQKVERGFLDEKSFDLKAELKSIGMTQREFAKHLESSTNTINRWATGDVKTPKVIKLYLKAYKKAKLYDELKFKID